MLNKIYSLFSPHSHSPHKRGLSPAVILILILLLSLFVPQLAHAAETLKLGTNNAWPIFVYGNPKVVRDILVGVSLMIDPQAGESGFRYAMYAISLVGFLVLAVMAGYDPAKNFIKMFSYVIMVWIVTLFTFNLKVNADVVDVLSQDGNNSYIVQNAPALAVIPMSFMFKLGSYLNNQIELAYNIPSTFKTGTPGVGTFNLFGKMAEDSGKFVITSPSLRQSLSAYAADCVVPAIATGRLSGAGRDSLKQPVTYYGTEAIIKSSDYWATLGTAAHNSILTKYYPKVSDANWYTKLPQAIRDNLPASNPEAMVSVSPSTGIIVPCSAAYTTIGADLDKEAESLKNQTAAQFSTTGTTTVYETIMNEFLAAASTGYSSPASYMKQQALIDLSAETFRNSATAAGNNEVMQAAAIAQAEAQQKSTWGAAFHTFNNMMGYVYVVLQAFIFAITPIILLALVVPGMGKGITGNYIQILLWLALWPPMLGVINFVITLFGMDAVRGAYADQGGFRNLSNTAMISQRTNDLVLAAQFLGTMVPMISWGIIKGAMAFTEFISAGVGSQFASQAGAQAATGNYSLNNGSMNNTTLDKTSLAMSAGVGFDGVKAAHSASALDITRNAGGSSMAASGKSVELGRVLGQTAQAAESLNETVSTSVNSALANAQSWGQVVDRVKSSTTGVSQQAALQRVSQLMRQTGVSESAANAAAAGDSAAVGKAVTAQTASSAKLELSAGLPRWLGIAPSGSMQKGAETGEAVKTDKGQNAATTNSAGQVVNAGTGASGGTAAASVQAATKAAEAAKRESTNHGFNQAETLQKATSLQTAHSKQVQAAISETRSLSMATDLDAVRADAAIKRLEALTGANLKSFGQLEQDRLHAKDAADTLIANTGNRVGNADKPGERPAAATAIHNAAFAAGQAAAGAASTLPTRQEIEGGVARHHGATNDRMASDQEAQAALAARTAAQQEEIRRKGTAVAGAVDGAATVPGGFKDGKDEFEGHPKPVAATPAERGNQESELVALGLADPSNAEAPAYTAKNPATGKDEDLSPMQRAGYFISGNKPVPATPGPPAEVPAQARH